MSECKLATPTNFTRGISAKKLDYFRLYFVSVSDECGSVINDYLELKKLTGLNSLKAMKIWTMTKYISSQILHKKTY